MQLTHIELRDFAKSQAENARLGLSVRRPTDMIIGFLSRALEAAKEMQEMEKKGLAQ